MVSARQNAWRFLFLGFVSVGLQTHLCCPVLVLESAAVVPSSSPQGERTGRRRLCSSRYEREAHQQGWLRIAGVDEAGRGALFGPVVAAAVILDPRRRIVGLDDSKRLPAARREVLAERIKQRARAWAVAVVEADHIDAWNIYQASRQAMAEAVRRLAIPPDYLLVDAMTLDLPIEQRALVRGDARSVSIAAASILAKVTRDALMFEWDARYPQYGLARNKGYSTPDHLAALQRYGPTPLHRFSFAPVRLAQSWSVAACQQPLPLFTQDDK
ncbi:MAG: ribonuclease HII [Firmicutes bacterium]|nr:ribonuclease HII [Bacillota bacterium]